MESLSLEEENIIKDIRSLYTAIKAIKDRILRYIKNLFEHQKLVRVSKDLE